MEKYYAAIIDNLYFDIWSNKKTDNFVNARLYNSITDLKADCINLKDYTIKELTIDNEYNLISEITL